MIEDAELLRRYANDHSEPAFAELVQRRVNLVYSVALRQTGNDAHLAQDVTQRVFTDLARKASQLTTHTALSGWLYRSTQLAAIEMVRAERRRRVREQEAHLMNEDALADAPIDGEKIRPLLDQVLSELDDDDRNALALRFFEERSFAEIGAAFRFTEDAARKRVARALDKLHGRLAQRGVTSTAAALGMMLGSQVGVAAPTGLAAAVASGALAAMLPSAGLATTVTTFMSMTKLQIGVAGVVAVLGTMGFVRQSQSNVGLRAERDELRRDSGVLVALQLEKQGLIAARAEIETLRRDDSELVRLRDEMATLRARMNQIARTEVALPEKKSAWPNGGPVYEAAMIDQQPVASYKAMPQYPAEFRRDKVEGQTVMSFVVDSEGNVQDARVVSSTHRQFEVAALEALKKWKFTAGQKSGQPVNARIEMPFKFILQKDPAPSPASWF